MLGFGQIPGINEVSVFLDAKSQGVNTLVLWLSSRPTSFYFAKEFFSPINILVPLRGPERKHLESAQQLEGGSAGSHTAPLRSNTLSDMSEALGQKKFFKDFFKKEF